MTNLCQWEAKDEAVMRDGDGEAFRVRLRVAVERVRLNQQEPRVRVSPYKPMRMVGIIALEKDECRFPSGEDSSGHTFCGLATEKGKPYCPKHMARTSVPIQRYRKNDS